MYNDWPSDLLPLNGWGDEHAISAFKDTIPWNVGRDFVAGTAKHLYDNLGLKKPKPSAETKIVHDKQLQILMPAIGYGLSFPLNEHEILRNCVSIYNEWLSALLPEPKPSVPVPILRDPNHYAIIIINHFYYLFVPRSTQAVDEINRQALLCHRVLRTLQDIAKNSNVLNEESWQTLLVFLLHINSALLSPPTVVNDAGEQLGDRVLSVLFETWLLACSKCFPPPPLWNALRESCERWRHRAGLVDQWNRITSALTTKLLLFMYGESFVSNRMNDEDVSIVPSEMSKDCIAQVWFRMLHIIGNPVDLCRQQVISKTPAFLKYAITSDLVIEPYQHPCLAQLPQIFLAAMKGISSLVDAFLGVGSSSTKSKADGLSCDDKEATRGPKLDFVKGRARCNSILHLFGPWLFEAALVNCSLSPLLRSDHSISSTGSGSGQRRSAASVFSSGDHRSLESSSSVDTDRVSNSGSSRFWAGRAEAVGALCRIFCSKKTGEEILPVYLARFYLALREGLTLKDEAISVSNEEQKRGGFVYTKLTCSETASSILLNGPDMFRLDLDGVLTVMAPYLTVLSSILFECRAESSRESLGGAGSITPVSRLRRAATHILLSLLPLPLHFQGLVIKELTGPPTDRGPLSLQRSQLVNMISGALQVETDAANIQMLLAGLVFCVQDSTLYEWAENGAQNGDSADKTSQMASSDSAHGLYVRAIYLVSHCLMSSWTKDVNVSLAGLELLSNLALLNFGELESDECKCAVKWLCDYIVFQCSRPPQAHSKDLHSMIVAAFHCASVWLVAHPYLLQDEESLATVLEVIELGISGSKSQGKSGDPPVFKHEKGLKPLSMRVRDAAEALLSCVLSQVGSFPSGFGVESLSSLLDETTLVKHCNGHAASETPTKENALQHIRYFVTQNNILLGLLEQPLVNYEDPQPSVTALVRGPFGRSVWTMQLRHLPRHKSSGKQLLANPGRPLPMGETSQKRNIAFRFFPESVDRIPQCKADKSIPTLEQIITSDPKSASDHAKLADMIHKQTAFEKRARSQQGVKNPRHRPADLECSPPPLCQEFQTARIFLSHFGLLAMDGLIEFESTESDVPNLVALDSNASGFVKDLESLDSTNNRTTDTAHVFYVRAGQTQSQDILANGDCLSELNSNFLEFVEGLGWPVNVHRHPGWTGHVSTSFLSCSAKDVQGDSLNNLAGSENCYDGRTRVLYWSDALSEMAFVAPSCPVPFEGSAHNCPPGGSLSLDGSVGSSRPASERSDSLPPTEAETEGSSLSSHTSQMSVNETKPRRYGRQLSSHACSNHRIFIVWLESFEDAAYFPKGDFIDVTSTGLESSNSKGCREIPVFVVFIHPLANGLFKIRLEGHLNKLNLAGPLVDGQVVSRRVLGTMVRQTALNMCRRRRLESDSYHPPHVRRKFKIQEMVQKYKCEFSKAEFYTKLFTTQN